MHAVYTTGTRKSLAQIGVEARGGEGFLTSSQQLRHLWTPTSSQHPEDPTSLHRTTVDLTMFTADVKVELSIKLSAELFRAIKKQPPLRLTYDLIYVSIF